MHLDSIAAVHFEHLMVLEEVVVSKHLVVVLLADCCCISHPMTLYHIEKLVH